MITKEQLDVIRKSFGDMGHGKGELIVELCDEIEALIAKPATPNPKAEKLRTIVSLLMSFHPMRHDLQEAADEIDRLTLLLQGADMQLKERENTIEVLKGSIDFLQRYNTEGNKPAIEPVNPTGVCSWIRNSNLVSYNTSCGTDVALQDPYKLDLCPYCNRPLHLKK